MKWFVIVGVSNPSFSQQGVCRWQKELYCVNRVSQYLKYNECIVHCQLVLWWSFCLEIQSIWSSIFDVWWFNPEELLHKMDRAWNSQTEAFIDYLRRKMVLGSSCQNEKKSGIFLAAALFTNNNLIIIILERILADQWISSSVKYLK